MNPIVIYKSEYGATKKYAEHIAKSLSCKAIPLGEAQNMPLDAYDAIVFGGGVYVGKINIAKFIAKHFDKLKDKKLAVFTVCLDPMNDPSLMKSWIAASFPAGIAEQIKLFHFRGYMDINKLSFIHRTMMRMMTKMLAKRPASERSDFDNNVIAIANGKAEDFFDTNAATPLVEFMKN